jgi:hypothetical protein
MVVLSAFTSCTASYTKPRRAHGYGNFGGNHTSNHAAVMEPCCCCCCCCCCCAPADLCYKLSRPGGTWHLLHTTGTHARCYRYAQLHVLRGELNTSNANLKLSSLPCQWQLCRMWALCIRCCTHNLTLVCQHDHPAWSIRSSCVWNLGLPAPHHSTPTTPGQTSCRAHPRIPQLTAHGWLWSACCICQPHIPP